MLRAARRLLMARQARVLSHCRPLPHTHTAPCPLAPSRVRTQVVTRPNRARRRAGVTTRMAPPVGDSWLRARMLLRAACCPWRTSVPHPTLPASIPAPPPLPTAGRMSAAVRALLDTFMRAEAVIRAHDANDTLPTAEELHAVQAAEGELTLAEGGVQALVWYAERANRAPRPRTPPPRPQPRATQQDNGGCRPWSALC